MPRRRNKKSELTLDRIADAHREGFVTAAEAADLLRCSRQSLPAVTAREGIERRSYGLTARALVCYSRAGIVAALVRRSAEARARAAAEARALKLARNARG